MWTGGSWAVEDYLCSITALVLAVTALGCFQEPEAAGECEELTVAELTVAGSDSEDLRLVRNADFDIHITASGGSEFAPLPGPEVTVRLVRDEETLCDEVLTVGNATPEDGFVAEAEIAASELCADDDFDVTSELSEGDYTVVVEASEACPPGTIAMGFEVVDLCELVPALSTVDLRILNLDVAAPGGGRIFWQVNYEATSSEPIATPASSGGFDQEITLLTLADGTTQSATVTFGDAVDSLNIGDTVPQEILLTDLAPGDPLPPGDYAVRVRLDPEGAVEECGLVSEELEATDVACSQFTRPFQSQDVGETVDCSAVFP